MNDSYALGMTAGTHRHVINEDSPLFKIDKTNICKNVQHFFFLIRGAKNHSFDNVHRLATDDVDPGLTWCCCHARAVTVFLPVST